VGIEDTVGEAAGCAGASAPVSALVSVRNGGAVTLATSLEAAGGTGRGPASFEPGKSTRGAIATSASAAVTANRPSTGITILVQRFLTFLDSPFGIPGAAA
jgi:hypothetical protein